MRAPPGEVCAARGSRRAVRKAARSVLDLRGLSANGVVLAKDIVWVSGVRGVHREKECYVYLARAGWSHGPDRVLHLRGSL